MLIPKSAASYSQFLLIAFSFLNGSHFLFLQMPSYFELCYKHVEYYIVDAECYYIVPKNIC